MGVNATTATLGNTITGTIASDTSSDYAIGSFFATTDSNFTINVGAVLGYTWGNGNFKIFVTDSNGIVLGVSNVGVLSGYPATWKNVTFTTPIHIANAGTYGISAVAQVNNNEFYYRTIGNASAGFYGINSYSSPTTLTSNRLDAQVSIYVNYTLGTQPQPTNLGVVCLGDSITYGYGYVSTPYPTVLSALTGLTVVNEGFSGYTSSQILTVWNTISANGYTSIVLLAGINDVRDYYSVPALENNLYTIWHSAKLLNMKVYALTLTPFKGDSTNQIDHDTINNFIKNNATALGITVVDIYTSLNDVNNNGAYQSQYDSGDHVHPNQAGMNLIANMVANAMNNVPNLTPTPTPTPTSTTTPTPTPTSTTTPTPISTSNIVITENSGFFDWIGKLTPTAQLALVGGIIVIALCFVSAIVKHKR